MSLSGAAVLPSILRTGSSQIGLVKRASAVASERPGVSDAARWAGLIKAVAAERDPSAFAILFDYFAPRVKSFMRRSGVNEANADELAQEALLMVWRKAPLFDPSSVGASAWIFTIARNLRIDALRREKRGNSNEVNDIDLEFFIDEAPRPDARLLSAQMEARVRTAMAELSDEQLRVVELSFYEERAHAEIAEMLKIPLGTVKSRLRLAMNRLRNLLDDLA